MCFFLKDDRNKLLKLNRERNFMNFLEPFEYMIQGIDIHCLFEIQDIDHATKIHNAFLSYLDSNKILFQHQR
ncbi:MAG: hypothetical protein ACHQYQ_10460, partial [Bacteriovoracales bacterium]